MLFAYILVYWSNSTIHQLFAVFTLNMLQICYMAQFRPYENPTTNRIDLFNEVVTLMCTYCMLTFTGLVTSAQTRYKCGWVMAVLILGAMITTNLLIVLHSSLLNFIKWLRQRVLRRRRMRLHRQKLEMLKLIKAQLS